jgi:hypothetical protein
MPYVNYCQDQGMDCARRARLASSSEVAIYWRHLAFRWIGLAALDRSRVVPRCTIY